MFGIKRFGTATVLLALWIMQGCVERPLPPLPQQNAPHYWSSDEEAENIDVSDLDKNLTESDANNTPQEQEVPPQHPQIVQRIPFPVEEYRSIARVDAKGRGVIKGKIFIVNAYGETIPGRNTRLYLNPKTSYSDQWYEESFIGGRKMSKADDRLFNYLRFTSSDKNGNFAFYGVPPGTYYLIGSVRCSTECGYSAPKSTRLAALVTIHDKEIIVKDLSAHVE